jgi:hypothetical protein
MFHALYRLLFSRPLSQENRELRSKLAARAEDFEGLSFEELAKLLRESPVRTRDADTAIEAFRGSEESVQRDLLESREASNAGQFLDCLQEGMWREHVFLPVTAASYPEAIHILLRHGLIETSFTAGTSATGLRNVRVLKLTEAGRRFRNRMLMVGDREERRRRLWSVEQSAPASGSTSA